MVKLFTLFMNNIGGGISLLEGDSYHFSALGFNNVVAHNILHFIVFTFYQNIGLNKLNKIVGVSSSKTTTLHKPITANKNARASMGLMGRLSPLVV